VLETTHEHPEWVKRRVARSFGVAEGDHLNISPTGVRGVWVRHGLTTHEARVAWAAKQPEAKYRVVCPSCHRSFLATGKPPFACPHCRVGGIHPRARAWCLHQNAPRRANSPKCALNS